MAMVLYKPGSEPGGSVSQSSSSPSPEWWERLRAQQEQRRLMVQEEMEAQRASEVAAAISAEHLSAQWQINRFRLQRYGAGERQQQQSKRSRSKQQPCRLALLTYNPTGEQGSELAVYRPQRLRPSICMQRITIESAAVATAPVLEDSDPTAQPRLRSLATSAIGLAALSLVPDQLGRSKLGGPTITSQMRDTVNRRRAACKLVSVLHDSSGAAILGRQLAEFSDRLNQSVGFADMCAEELVAYFSRWGVSTLTGALSTLTRIRCFAEAEAEYDAVDSDVYPAQLTNKFLDSINSAALAKAQQWQSNAEMSGVEITEQQRRRDGRSAAKTAFRSLRFLLDNAKMDTAARDSLVCKRKFATTIPIPTPAAEPYHYAQLCYLAAHSHDPVVAGTAGGFALVA